MSRAAEGRTIFALSSGTPPAAIAIVRISGPDADAALSQLVKDMPEPRRATLGTLRHPESGETLDRGLLLRFPGSCSATGEDLVELHLHGGRAVVAAVLEALGCMPGLRAAEPGEFTRRAFENGRIDLTEAEGLADLLQAETQGQRRAAIAMAGGALSRKVEHWQETLLTLSARLESVLDFSEEDEIGEVLSDDWYAAVGALRSDMERVLQSPPAERLKDGIRVVIAGPPNAGKSSLLNRLTGRQAAITSAIAGTTRDVIEAPTAIGGTPFVLVDTAGLRESEDEVEAMGVERARARLAAADLILWLGPPADCPDRSRSILVRSKADLLTGSPDWGVDVVVSAETGQGIQSLVDLLIERARNLLPGESDLAIHARHRELIGECMSHLTEAGRLVDLLVIGERLRLSRGALDRLTGRAGVEDMLDRLFDAFCIGK